MLMAAERQVLRAATALCVSAILVTAAAAQNAASDVEALPDTHVAYGTRDIAEAWFAFPTTAYLHFVQGSEHEAAGLRVLTEAGEVVTHRLDERFVFEDRWPRLADLDGDGEDEVVVVLTSVREGASLAAFSLEGGELVLKAQTPYLGEPYRWLNPAGIADYDGDGTLDVALVATPHLNRTLEVWTLEDEGFRLVLTTGDVSNHRNGSSFTAMAASADFNGDGVSDLAIPDGSRTAIRVLSFGAGEAREIGRFDLPAPADGDFALSESDQGLRLDVPLEDGSVAAIALME